MNSLNDIFFPSSEDRGITYEEILDSVQRYCTEVHTSTIANNEHREAVADTMKEVISQYLIQNRYQLEGYSTEKLCDRLYEDMAGISFLRKWIYETPGIEEVNINAYDDIEIIRSGGRSEKIQIA